MNVKEFSNELKQLMRKYNLKSITPLDSDALIELDYDSDLITIMHSNFQFNKDMECSIMDERYFRQTATDKVKEIVMAMNGLSEDGFRNRMFNDSFFRKGFDVLVELFIQAKFNN